MAIVSSESFAYSSRAGILEQHMQFAQSPMHLAESAAPSSSIRLQSSINFGRQTVSITVCKNSTKITLQ